MCFYFLLTATQCLRLSISIGLQTPKTARVYLQCESWVLSVSSKDISSWCCYLVVRRSGGSMIDRTCDNLKSSNLSGQIGCCPQTRLIWVSSNPLSQKWFTGASLIWSDLICHLCGSGLFRFRHEDVLVGGQMAMTFKRLLGGLLWKICGFGIIK